MCGIVGFQGEFDRYLLDRMSRSVAHRGPDGDGAVILGRRGRERTGLGHRRLAIIDLSEAGLQPMAYAPPGLDADACITLVYNGEIYNYRELRAELERDGHIFKGHSDTEVLLHLYARDGLQMLPRLNGIFAFAIHDARPAGRPEGVAQGAMVIARDHLGVKPLYYTESASGLLFGSELKALLQSRDTSREIDPVALHQMLAYLWTPAPRTMLSGVRKLEPGCALIVAEGRVQRQFAFYVVPFASRATIEPRGEVAASLTDTIARAVERQLVADVPVGAFLSGGLDSSAVVAMMRRAMPNQKIQTFTIGFEETGDVDGNPADLPYARRVAQHLGVDLEEITMSPRAIERLPEMVRLLDEPQADPAPINALLIAERARAMRIPVLLSGAGGDDLFTGYRRHWALQFERRWSWLPAAFRGGIQSVANRMASGSIRGQSNPALRRLAKMFAYAGETADRRLVSYFWWSTEALRRSLYTPEFAARTAGIDVADPLLASLHHIPAERDRLQQMLYLETRHFLADHNLNYTDRAGMAVGVEVRVPLLDLEVVDHATRIHSSMKQQGSVGKAIFKQAMEPFLPRDVIYRPKSGFGAPLRRWLKHELRDMMEDLLSPVALRSRGFFDYSAVRRLIELDKKGFVDGSYTLFALMCFELWCREFIDTPR